MEKKLNLHDLFGFLFPGAVLCACAYYFLLKRWFPIEKVDWSATLILLPFVYVMGVMVHQLAHKLFHESGVAVKLMKDSDPKEPLTDVFTVDFKREVKKAYTELFKLSPDGADPNLTQMYLLCNDFVLQQGKGIYVESHYAIYSLCRSMVLVSFLSGSAGLFGRALSTGCSIHFICPGYSILILIALSTILATCTFWFAKQRFIKTLAVAVYRAFYSAYCDFKMPPPKTPTAELQND
jgi:hypothetical protein